MTTEQKLSAEAKGGYLIPPGVPADVRTMTIRFIKNSYDGEIAVSTLGGWTQIDLLPNPYEKDEGIADFHAAGRHSHITALVRSGASLPETQKLARHTDIKQTMKYTHIGIND